MVKLWVSAGGKPATKINVSNDSDIDDVKGILFPDVPIAKRGDITIKLKEDGKALEVDATIESLLKKGGGTNKDNALYVHFDEPSASIDQQQDSGTVARRLEKIDEKLELVLEQQERSAERMEALTHVAGMLAPDAYSGWDPDWRNRVMQHYRVKYCAFLRSLLQKADWQGFAFWLFKAIKDSTVGEHVFPNNLKYALLGRQAEIEIWSPRNGLPVLKGIEDELGKGNIQLLPNTSTPGPSCVLDVYVAALIRNQIITTSCEEWENPKDIRKRRTLREEIWVFKGDSWRQVTFGDLHEGTVRLSEMPFHRALYHKALMAFNVHPEEFAHPATRWRTFLGQRGKTELLQKLGLAPKG